MGRWTWPLNPRPMVVHDFGVGPNPWSPGHRGVDLAGASKAEAPPPAGTRPPAGTSPPAGSSLPAGTPIRAPANGVVHFAGIVAGRPVLSIAHGSGLISSFEPAISTLERGHPVQRNEIVGRIAPGPTHCAPGTCLHWGVRQNERYLNPLLLLPVQRGPAVLLRLPRR
jgi:murein DD-endopeptidase MepM/ murein hydrolase activator NlpD